MGLNGTFNIDNSTCEGLMMIRSIRDFACIISFQLKFKKHELIEFESGGFAVLDCFNSAQGVRIQDESRIRMAPGRMYSNAGYSDPISMLFSSRKSVSWFVTIIAPDKYSEYTCTRFPDFQFDITDILRSLNGRPLFNELQVILGQLTGRPNRASSEMYYESKFNEVIAWLIDYSGQSHSQAQDHTVHISEEDRKAILKTAELIRRQPGAPLDLSDLASAVLVSTSKLRKDFKAVMGCTIGEFRNQERLRLATDLLSDTDLSYKEIADRLGYKKLENFNLFFKRYMKSTPREYRQMHSSSNARDEN